MLEQIKNMLAITLQTCVTTVGLMPEDCGDAVKAVLATDDDVALIALGCYLDECIELHSYTPLRDGLSVILARTTKGASK